MQGPWTDPLHSIKSQVIRTMYYNLFPILFVCLFYTTTRELFLFTFLSIYFKSNFFYFYLLPESISKIPDAKTGPNPGVKIGQDVLIGLSEVVNCLRVMLVR